MQYHLRYRSQYRRLQHSVDPRADGGDRSRIRDRRSRLRRAQVPDHYFSNNDVFCSSDRILNIVEAAIGELTQLGLNG